MNRKIIAAGIGVAAAVTLITVLLKKNRCRRETKPEKDGNAEHPIETKDERDLIHRDKESATVQERTAEVEQTESTSDSENKDQPAEKSGSVEMRQSVQTSRRVGQYDDEMNLLAEYESATAAAKAIGSNRTSIRDVANGKQKHAAGYVWRYLD